jgi:type II secretory pathway component GspD/PulD (secretin)
VIGSVTSDQANYQQRAVPVFGKIPVLGALFRSRENNSTGEEIIVIITPSVVTDPNMPSQR